MELCTDTQAVVADAIDQSAREVFQMMAGFELHAIGEPSESPSEAATSQYSVTVVTGLSGDLQGSLLITMSEDAACQWTGSLLATDVKSVDQTVIDGVGELGNMVVGGAKRRLSDFDLTMSLPSVLQAGMDRMRLPSKLVPVYRDYGFDEHLLSIMIALSRV